MALSPSPPGTLSHARERGRFGSPSPRVGEGVGDGGEAQVTA
jgi:hypothetical protein